MENGHRNSEFSHQKWWFSRATLNYQRVYLMGKSWNAMENGFILWFPLDFLSHHPNRSIDFCDLHRRISQDFFLPCMTFFVTSVQHISCWPWPSSVLSEAHPIDPLTSPEYQTKIMETNSFLMGFSRSPPVTWQGDILSKWSFGKNL